MILTVQHELDVHGSTVMENLIMRVQCSMFLQLMFSLVVQYLGPWIIHFITNYYNIDK